MLTSFDPLVYLHTGRRGVSIRVPIDMQSRADRREIEGFFDILPEVVQRFRLRYVLSTDSDYPFEIPSLARPAYAGAIAKAGYVLRASGRNWRVLEVAGSTR